jgi:hypothetical protein
MARFIGCRQRKSVAPNNLFVTIAVVESWASYGFGVWWAPGSAAKGSRVLVVGRLAQRFWQADDGSTRSWSRWSPAGLGPSLRWATASRTWTTSSPSS